MPAVGPDEGPAGSLRAERERGVAQSLARKWHFRAPVPSALESYLVRSQDCPAPFRKGGLFAVFQQLSGCVSSCGEFFLFRPAREVPAPIRIGGLLPLTRAKTPYLPTLGNVFLFLNMQEEDAKRTRWR